ncbi:MAG TPA: TetR family transcriptional regulator [Myxococcota bacterium]|nr:TetR family transcriptional regulator [Myxococcota bacterium]
MKKPPARRRNAAATRAAILASARRAFAHAGYDGAGVREIARGAGVTAMLVNRYFGSKEALFAEVVADTMANPVILVDPVLRSASPGRAIAEALVELTEKGAAPLDGFRVMLASTANARAAEIARGEIEKHHQKTMTAALRGKLAPERAALVLSLVAGVQVMRQMIGLSALADAERRHLARLLAPLFEKLVDS